MKKFRIRSILFYVIMTLLSLYIILNIIATPKQVIKVFRLNGYRVSTPSMEPVINVNDIAVIRIFNPDNLKKGDIITFETYVAEANIFEKVIVTHYIGDIYEVDGVKYYKTQSYRDKGTNTYDMNWVNENKEPIDINSNNIIGKYAFKIPWIGVIISFIQTLFNDPILFILVLINIIVIYLLIKYIIKHSKKTDN